MANSEAPDGAPPKQETDTPEVKTDTDANSETLKAEAEGDLTHEVPDEGAVRNEPEAPEEVTETLNEPSEVARTKTAILPLMLGGLIAGTLGFIAARSDIFDPALPPSWRSVSYDAEIATLTSTINDLNGALAEIEAQIADLQIADTSDTVTPLRTGLAQLEERIAKIEAQPASTAPAAPTIDLRPLNETLSAQQAQIDALRARAATEASRTEAQTAVNRLFAAVVSGSPFAPALTELRKHTSVEIPSILLNTAETGVPSLADLQQSLPDAARTALAAVRAENAGDDQGIAGFIARQFGVRSVVPREGSDPDAILSRVEGAVRNGDLETALKEADALPLAAKEALQIWQGQARSRLDTILAAEALSQRLAQN